MAERGRRILAKRMILHADLAALLGSVGSLLSHGIHMEPGFGLPSGPRADSYWSDVITHRQKSCLTPTSPSKSVLPMMSQKWMIGP